MISLDYTDHVVLLPLLPGAIRLPVCYYSLQVLSFVDRSPKLNSSPLLPPAILFLKFLYASPSRPLSLCLPPSRSPHRYISPSLSYTHTHTKTDTHTHTHTHTSHPQSSLFIYFISFFLFSFPLTSSPSLSTTNPLSRARFYLSPYLSLSRALALALPLPLSHAALFERSCK